MKLIPVMMWERCPEFVVYWFGHVSIGPDTKDTKRVSESCLTCVSESCLTLKVYLGLQDFMLLSLLSDLAAKGTHFEESKCIIESQANIVLQFTNNEICLPFTDFVGGSKM
jgi:hypothetical protein